MAHMSRDCPFFGVCYCDPCSVVPVDDYCPMHGAKWEDKAGRCRCPVLP